jgi:hypothetical protein
VSDRVTVLERIEEHLRRLDARVAALEAVREAAEEYLNDLDVEGVSTTAYLAAAVAAANPEAKKP